MQAARRATLAWLWTALFLTAPVHAGALARDATDGGCAGCGSITGQVLEAGSGTPVAGAEVLAFLSSTVQAVRVTGSDGRFDTGLVLQPGDYRIEVRHEGHVTTRHGDVPCPLPWCDQGAGAIVSVASGEVSVADVTLRRGARLGGVVTFPPGEQFTGEVWVVSATHPGSTLATVDPDTGLWRTTHTLPADSYRVYTSNTSGLVDEAWPDTPCRLVFCFDQGDPIPVSEGQVVNGVHFDLAAGGRVQGVVSLDGAGVESATIVFNSEDGTYQRVANTQPDGSYQTGSGLPPGSWRAWVLPASDRLGQVWPGRSCTTCNPAHGDAIAVAAAATVGPIDFPLEQGGRLSGRISAASTGAPLGGASVHFYSLAYRIFEASVSSAADGSYTSPALPPGDYTVGAIAPGFVFQVLGAGGCPTCAFDDGTPLTVPNNTTLHGIDLALGSASTVSGRVTDPEGAAVAGVRVHVFDQDFIGYSSEPTGADGRYAVNGVQPGSYFAVAGTTGHLLETVWPDIVCSLGCAVGTFPRLELQAGEQRDDIDIVMQRGAVVEGRVTASADGAPIDGAGVHLIPTSDDTEVIASAVTQPDGTYRSTAVPAGSYYLRTSAGFLGYIDEAYDDVPCHTGCDNALLVPVTLHAGDTATADFALDRGGRVSGRVTRASDGQPFLAPRPSVQILDQDGVLVSTTLVHADGSYISDGLPPGPWFVRTRNRSGYLDELFDDVACFWCRPPQGNAITLLPGVITPDVDFALDPGAVLGGRLTEAGGGQPVAGVTVMVNAPDGVLVTSASSAADGSWRTSNGVPPGTYYVSTRSLGRYRDQGYGGHQCDGACAPPVGAAVTVTGTTEVSGLDFALLPLPLLRDGFED